MIVTIPSIGESALLRDLIHVLLDEPCVSEIMLIDNSYAAYECHSPALAAALDPVNCAAKRCRKLRLVVNHPETIYGGWNRGISRGAERGESVALLNDDIILTPGALTLAESKLPGWGLLGLDYFSHGPLVNLPVRAVNGTFRTTGFGGFAFIVPPDAPFVDDRFQWWYGDDDLAERIKAQGRRLGVAMGCTVEHPQPSTTGSKHSWTQTAAGEDTRLFRTLWPDAP